MSTFWDKAASLNNSEKVANNVTENPTSMPIFWQQAENVSIPEEESSFLSQLPRHAARSGSRIAETLLGLPGDILSIPRNIAEYGIEKFQGSPLTEKQKKILPSQHGIPTSHDIKEFAQKHTGEYLKPQNEGEEIADEAIALGTSLFNPTGLGKELTKPQKALELLKRGGKALGIGATSVAAGKGVESVAGKEAGNYAKLGTAFLMSLHHPTGKSVNQYVGDVYKEMESSIPQGAKVRAVDLENNLRTLKHNVSKGTLAPSEKFVADEVDKVLKKIEHGAINVDELVATKRSLSEKMNEFVYANPDKAAKGRARKLVTSIDKDLDKTLSEYSKHNPTFGKNYKDAQQAFGAIAQSNKIRSSIGDFLKTNKNTGIISTLFGITQYPALAIKTGGAGAATWAALESGMLLTRIAKGGPALRRYYGEVLSAAAKENSKALAKSVNDLNREYEKEYGEYKFPN